MIQIDVPKEDIAVRVNNIELIPRKSGIYLLYGEDKNLLYIGKAENLRDRVKVHVSGQDFSSRKFSRLIQSISCIFVSCPMERDIYETYMINVLKPTFNTKKVYLYESEIMKNRRLKRRKKIEEENSLRSEKNVIDINIPDDFSL